MLIGTNVRKGRLDEFFGTMVLKIKKMEMEERRCLIFFYHLEQSLKGKNKLQNILF